MACPHEDSATSGTGRPTRPYSAATSGSPLGEAGNAHHVVTGADGAALDGFTIADGCADGAGIDGHGAGLALLQRRLPGGPPTAASYACVRTTAARRTPTTCRRRHSRDARFIGCHADSGAADGGSSLLFSELRGCRFIGDSARWRGGAVQIDYGSGPGFSDCVFESCSSGGHGGALFLESVAAQIGVIGTTVDACVFVANTSGAARRRHRGGRRERAAHHRLYLHRQPRRRRRRRHQRRRASHRDERACVFRDNDGGPGEADIDADELSTVPAGRPSRGFPSPGAVPSDG